MKHFTVGIFLSLTQCYVRCHGSVQARASIVEEDSKPIIDRSLIIGGEAAEAGDYPYFVHFRPPGCGGTLIAPDVVLTAGHVSSKIIPV